MDVLTISGLNKTYPGFTLRDVSFSVRQGEIMGFIGRNGAGKTTTLKSLLNFVHPDKGDIRFFGGRTFAESEEEIKRRIGFVSGGGEDYPRKKLRVITQVTKSFYPSWDEKAYREYLARFSLDESKTPEQLSAGMKVKYRLALALSHRAELLILDEPTSGLDPVSRDDLLDVFLTLSRKGVSILFSTHITSDLERCADRITYIRQGQVVVSENLDAFRDEYRLAVFSVPPQDAQTLNKLIGLREEKRSWTALIRAGDARQLDIPCVPADLDSIMVHMERG